ncbi:MAG: heparinase II/III family protein [Candidatus Hydrogenedentes bacterium]|nr:heparinase II/III family protein [Candidatus Hydrogenedentota bacterium]
MIASTLFALGVFAAFAQETVSVGGTVSPDRVERLFEAFDLEAPALAPVREYVQNRDWGSACDALLTYYRQADNPAFPQTAERPAHSDAAVAIADAALNDTFTFYEQTATVPRLPDGGLQWDYTGPEGDKEWAWALNRHKHLDWLLTAYQMTGDAKYAAAWSDSVRDWVLQNPYAEPNENPLVWRGLETQFRVRAWARGFYALQDEPAFTAEARILLLSSIPDHARYLRSFHKETSNWIAMELNGLATAGVAWPEFRDAEAWVDYSVDRLTKELTAQVYPDGAQMELTASYHRVTLINFESLVDLLRHTQYELPVAFPETIESMWNYLAYTLRPTGYSPLNNDSDFDHNGPGLVQKASDLNRPDWAFVATNGANGTQPDGLPSRVFPWAGQLIMRSGWDRDAHWAFFDAGPMGIGHRHADKLHLSVSAYGRDILVDGGRYTYVGGEWRNYFTGSASHNVILIDGQGQRNHPFATDTPMDDHFVTAPEYDLGYGVFESGFGDVEGDVKHERLVYYKRGGYWIVVDRITTDRSRRVTALWHFHPDCTVTIEGQSAVSTDADAGNVRIVPSSGTEWDVSLAAGQEEPEIQGWWSREYNHKAPSPAVVYDRNISGTETFAWLIVPAKGVPPEATFDADVNHDTVECNVAFGETNNTVYLEVANKPLAR